MYFSPVSKKEQERKRQLKNKQKRKKERIANAKAGIMCSLFFVTLFICGIMNATTLR